MHENDPLVSIVMPVYNGLTKGMLMDAIRSCLNQSYQNIELILVDDCSTDGTYRCFEEFAAIDKRVRIIRNYVNKKLPASLNIGFNMARGEYFTWTSDDNFYMPNAIEEMMICFKQNQTVDILYADFIVIDKCKMIKQLRTQGSVNKLVFRNTVGACFLYKNTVDTALNGYNEDRFLVEDYDFWVRAYGKFNYMHLNKLLYYYTEHESSLTLTRQREVVKAELHLVREYIVDNDLFSVDDRLKRCKTAVYDSIQYRYLWSIIYFTVKYMCLSVKCLINKH